MADAYRAAQAKFGCTDPTTLCTQMHGGLTRTRWRVRTRGRHVHERAARRDRTQDACTAPRAHSQLSKEKEKKCHWVGEQQSPCARRHPHQPHARRGVPCRSRAGHRSRLILRCHASRARWECHAQHQKPCVALSLRDRALVPGTHPTERDASLAPCASKRQGLLLHIRAAWPLDKTRPTRLLAQRAGHGPPRAGTPALL